MTNRSESRAKGPTRARREDVDFLRWLLDGHERAVLERLRKSGASSADVVRTISQVAAHDRIDGARTSEMWLGPKRGTSQAREWLAGLRLVMGPATDSE
jgi:hypothetical protein